MRKSKVLDIVEDADSSLLELIDQLLGKGVVVRGEIVLGLADVDLIYVQLSALLCEADRVLPPRKPKKERA